MPERERPVPVQLDPPERIEHRGSRADGYLERIEPPSRVPPLVAIDAEPPGRRRRVGRAHANLRSVSA